MNEKEGIIKFNCIFEEDSPPNGVLIAEMNTIRNKLHKAGMINIDSYNIGYGNISIRYMNGRQFIITGTQTAGKENLSNRDYSLVKDFDIAQNKLICTGKIKASSESLTHAAVYHAVHNANSVIHIHSSKLWEKFCNKLPTTPEEFEYGTPEIALAVAEICKSNTNSIIILGGHRDGIVSYGKNPNDAYVNIMNLYKI